MHRFGARGFGFYNECLQAYTSDLKSSTVRKTWSNNRAIQYSLVVSPGSSGFLRYDRGAFADVAIIFPLDLNENQITKTEEESEQAPSMDRVQKTANWYIMAQGTVNGDLAFCVNIRLYSTAAALYA